MTSIRALAVVVAVVGMLGAGRREGLAQAVPVADPATAAPAPPPWTPPPQPYLVPPPPCGSCNVAPPGYYQPNPSASLTRQEHELLLQGEISDNQYLLGALTSIFVGFGTGQAVQGRWSDTGWIFTVGESVSILTTVAGVAAVAECADGSSGSRCRSDRGTGLLLGGLIGLVAFRGAELIDVFTGPSRHNRRVRALRQRIGAAPGYYGRVRPYLAPTGTGDGALAGVAARF